MIPIGLSRRAVPVALALALMAPAACSKKQNEPTPDNHTRSRGEASPARHQPGERPRPRPAITVTPVPPGAPTQGDILAFPPGSPVWFDWRKTPLWAESVRSLVRFPRDTRIDVLRILDKGWGDPGAMRLLKHTKRVARELDQATRLPPCAPLRKTWTNTHLFLEQGSLLILRTLQTTLLLRARYHQHQGRPGPALDAATAALRYACHMAHVPEVIMQITALRGEQLALHILGDLRVDHKACRRLGQVLTSHRTRRPPLAHLAQADWLSARSHLRIITKGLTRAPHADARALKRLHTLDRLILERTSTRYRRYSQALMRGLHTGLESDWRKLDEVREEVNRGLAELKKKHGAKTSMDLADIVARLPGKPAAWTADVISKIFLGLVTLGSSIWKQARFLHHANLATLKRLQAKRCP